MKRSLVAFKTSQGRKIEPASLSEWNRILDFYEEGEKLTITIQPYLRKKSLGQNNLFHLLCEIIAKDLVWSREEVKLFMKDKYGQYEPLTDRNGEEMVDTDTGEIMQRMRSLSDYSKDEMTELINGVYEFGQKHGIRLPNPDDAKNNNLPIY